MYNYVTPPPPQPSLCLAFLFLQLLFFSSFSLSADWVRSKISFLVGPQESLLATVKRRELAWFEHVTRHNCRSKTILQDT